MINGLTVNTQHQKKMTFKGKISTGYAPGEGPNQEGYPVAAGFFRMLRSTVERKRVSGKVVEYNAWKINSDIQKALEDETKSDKPTFIKCVSMVNTPEQMWDSHLAMFNQKQEVMCKGYGEGTEASLLKEVRGERTRVPRECKYKECPDYKSGACRECANMIVWPLIDFSTLRPYKFTTNSINTIVNIETMLYSIYDQLKVAYVVEKNKNPEIGPFKGLFGLNFYLRHKRIKSGGRDVFVTELLPSKDVEGMISKPLLELASAENSMLLLTEVRREAAQIAYQGESESGVSVKYLEDDITEVAEVIEDNKAEEPSKEGKPESKDITSRASSMMD